MGEVKLSSRESTPRNVRGVHAENATLTEIDDDASTSFKSAVTSTRLQAHHEVKLKPIYNGVPMTAGQALGTILELMVVGDEDPDGLCHSIIMPGFTLTLRRDSGTGNPLLNFRQLVKMLRVLTRWIVAKNRFEELDFLIERDGNIIATGRLKQPQPLGELAVQ